MTGQHLNYTFHSIGTPTATYKATISLPVNATLVRVTAVGTNTNVGKLNLGTVADFDGYLDDFSFGTGNSPAVASASSDFNGALVTSGELLHFKKNDVIQMQVSSAGAYPNDPCVVLTFLEG